MERFNLSGLIVEYDGSTLTPRDKGRAEYDEGPRSHWSEVDALDVERDER